MPFIKQDRFGNDFQLIACKDKKGTGFSKGYVELGGKLYKVEPSQALSGKQDKNGVAVLDWVKITAVKKQTRKGSM